MDLEFLRQLRDSEIRRVAALIPPGARVLEIGAGAGWQAKCLSELGFDVQAIDIPASHFAAVQVYPVIPYDGRRIPFPDGTFAVVYSSNVLEHIPWIEEFQAEIQRVLAAGGIALHIMPSPWWRLWTSLAHYPQQAMTIAGMIRRAVRPAPASSPGRASTSQFGLWHRLGSALWPRRHGETGTSLAELALFSSRRWRALFSRSGWTVERIEGNGLFITGYSLLGLRLSMAWRARLACVLGSAYTLYVLRRPGGG